MYSIIYKLLYLQSFYSQVYKKEEFLLITFDQILQIIKSEDLCANEENVYESVMKWIKYDKENRNKHLPDLMEYVQSRKFANYFSVRN
ncbi:unnamed protein product [Macrosiphum euphorbiae]|uniref:BACK domain-containing protein n=1 Tax=Macrosiphum euphorbiae TaxID=13131 RepID=A0AAV0X702_9HEMI|nr:unnamed protein product [Macrosiphum euphorbiae]